jgi:hypothetical protein
MIYLYDRVQQVTATSGVGTISLSTSASYSGFQKFEDVLTNGQKTYYTISNSKQWEVGIGTYSSNTLARNTVLDSSSGVGNKINIYHQSQVFITYPARKSVVVDDNSIVSGNYTGILFPNGAVQTVAFTGQTSGVSELETATGLLNTDIKGVSGLLYNYWTLSVTGLNDQITRQQSLSVTGVGTSSLIYNAASNALTISGQPNTAGSGLVLTNGREFNIYGGTGNFKQVLFNSTGPVLVGYDTLAASKGLSIGDDAGR